MKHKRLLSIFLSIIIIGSSFIFQAHKSMLKVYHAIYRKFLKKLDDLEKRKENSHSSQE